VLLDHRSDTPSSDGGQRVVGVAGSGWSGWPQRGRRSAGNGLAKPIWSRPKGLVVVPTAAHIHDLWPAHVTTQTLAARAVLPIALLLVTYRNNALVTEAPSGLGAISTTKLRHQHHRSALVRQRRQGIR